MKRTQPVGFIVGFFRVRRVEALLPTKNPTASWSRWDMETQQRRPLTDRELRAWLAAGQTDRSIGEGLTFVASASSASKGKASWILRFRFNGRPREKVLSRYPELSLKAARDQARKDRGEIERGVDVAAAKQAVKVHITETQTVPPVQPSRRGAAVPSAEQALRAHQRDHHHQPELRRLGQRLRRRQDDHGLARSAHASLPHRRDRHESWRFKHSSTTVAAARARPTQRKKGDPKNSEISTDTGSLG